MNIRTLILQLAILLVWPSLNHANDLPQCDPELIEIIRNNKVNELEAALVGGCNPNCITPEGHSPLFLAAGLTGLDPKMTNILLINNADPKFRMDDKTNTIHNPAFYANPADKVEFSKICEKVFYILLRGGQGLVDQKDSFGMSLRQRNKRLVQCAESGLKSVGRYVKPKKNEVIKANF